MYTDEDKLFDGYDHACIHAMEIKISEMSAESVESKNVTETNGIVEDQNVFKTKS